MVVVGGVCVCVGGVGELLYTLRSGVVVWVGCVVVGWWWCVCVWGGGWVVCGWGGGCSH